jgi:hypothetical protein
VRSPHVVTSKAADAASPDNPNAPRGKNIFGLIKKESSADDRHDCY